MKDGRRFGRPPDPFVAPEVPDGVVNLTDPDSRNVKCPRGYVQGYNVQAVVTEQQIVIAAEVNTDSSADIAAASASTQNVNDLPSGNSHSCRTRST
jgi:hypothetical protein